MKIIIIAGFHQNVGGGWVNDVTLGKPYRIFNDAEGKIFFIDDSGDSNFGADVSKLMYIFDTFVRVEEQ